jgi:cell fate (sporulation/competence/biofilm development) regulator YlbF (YheA/YmcA/DUF963 family)
VPQTLVPLFVRNAFELQALQDAIVELKQSLSGDDNVSKFEDSVEVHMQHIMSGLSRYVHTYIHTYKHTYLLKT